MTAATVTTSTTTHSDQANTPRHRADPSAVRATKAVVRSYRRTIAARRALVASVDDHLKETQR